MKTRNECVLFFLEDRAHFLCQNERKGYGVMKKLFISQPMRGKSNEEIIAEREKAVKAAAEKLGEPVEVIDSFFKDAPVTAAPLWFLGKSLELLADADIIYFCPGWDTARGCKIEHQCAVEYGIERIYE
jgi:hypothetical protein